MPQMPQFGVNLSTSKVSNASKLFALLFYQNQWCNNPTPLVNVPKVHSFLQTRVGTYQVVCSRSGNSPVTKKQIGSAPLHAKWCFLTQTFASRKDSSSFFWPLRYSMVTSVLVSSRVQNGKPRYISWQSLHYYYILDTYMCIHFCSPYG